MRKYFLLSAVVMLATTSANAGQYTQLNVSADVEVMTEISCSPLSFSTIKVSDWFEGGYFSISADGDELSTTNDSGVIEFSGATRGACKNVNMEQGEISFNLSGENTGDTLSGTIESYYLNEGEKNTFFGGSVYIPADVASDKYYAEVLITSVN